MFNPNEILINAFIEELHQKYVAVFGVNDDDLNLIASLARTSLETIATTDAPYHDLNHTLLVTMVGQEIITGKHHMQGDVTVDDWIHFVAGLLNHDIGYVRGICRADRAGRYAINKYMDTITPPPGATDAFLTPYHVDRGKIYVKERFKHINRIDAARLSAIIERTRFPVPNEDDQQESGDYPGLVRAADLIGQLADPDYMSKTAALFAEFKETEQADNLGYHSAADVREAYPQFFWEVVSPYIEDGIRYLRRTQQGQTWVAHLYSNVFTEEHTAPAFGPERRSLDNDSQGSRALFVAKNLSSENPPNRRISDRSSSKEVPRESN